MRLSYLTILFVTASILMVIWGALSVIGIINNSFIPDQYEFLNLPSLAIVFGGILTNVFINYPHQSVLNSLKKCMRIFSQSSIDEEKMQDDIRMILDWEKKIKSNKFEAINELSEKYSGEFEGFLFSILSTNYSLDEVRDLAETNIHENYQLAQKENTILKNMGEVAPVFGMLGTLFGLIVMLSGLDNLNTLGSGLAAALMTTLYGLIIGNMIFIPLSRKLSANASRYHFREKLILEGVMLILEDRPTLQIYDSLTAHIKRISFFDLENLKK